MEAQKDEQQKPQQQEQLANSHPEENGTVIQEATSTTQEITKRSLRVQTWKKFRDEKLGGPVRVFNRIPDFVGSDKAAELLADTPEFKNAKNIKVNADRAQDPVKLLAISAGKNLFVPSVRDSKAVYTKIDCPADADEETKKKAIKLRDLKEEERHDVDLANKVKLDLIVIGSVVVSRCGKRIGRGNGYIDLDIAILIQAGIVTPQTVIVTTVHDIQVCDDFPGDLFKKYDVPVDIIVTPTEVIRVKAPPRPTGIYWELLSERRLKVVPVLQEIKESEEKLGKVIALKSEDTDVEGGGAGRRRRFFPRRQYNNRRGQRTKSETNNENQENNAPRSGRRKKRYSKGGKKSKSDGEQSSNENKENNQGFRKRRSQYDFCVKVSNISKVVRIKDLKSELRNRSCNPVNISWKGAFGKCYLHFSKRSGKETQDEINDVLNSLNDLSLTVQNGETSETLPLKVELLKNDNNPAETNRIESVSTTAV